MSDLFDDIQFGCESMTFFTITINIASFLLAIYLSLVGARPRLKRTVWIIAIMITIGNVYIIRTEASKEVLYFDILAPDFSSEEALGFVEYAFGEDIETAELIDVMGSYYTCLKKPDRFFHLFPEWVFVFRDTGRDSLIEFRVADSRLPPIPSLRDKTFAELLDPLILPSIHGGELVSFISFKVTPEYLGIPMTDDDDDSHDFQGSYIIVIVDESGRSLVELTGARSNDLISEVVESVNTKVFCRVRVAGRITDHVGNRTVIQDPGKLGKIVICRASFAINDFYSGLKPLAPWKFDVKDAISRVVDKGGLAIPPDKLGMEGGPGTVRLLNTAVENLNGPFWRIPYRIGIRPVLVHARSGAVYAVNNKGFYSTRWEKEFVLDDTLSGE